VRHAGGHQPRWTEVALDALLAGGSLFAVGLLIAIGVATWISSASAAQIHDRHRARLVASVTPVGGRSHWVASWSASPQAATRGNLSELGFTDQTIRNVVFTSAGGTMVRVLVTNAFGTRPLSVGHAAVGVRGQGAGVVAGRNEPLLFRGRRSVVIAPGAAVLSDPAPLRVLPLQALVVSLFLPRFTGPATQHADAEQVNYVADGDHVLDPRGAAYGTRTFSWYFVASVDVLAPARDLGAVAAIGDSITDGVGSPANANARWPNDLARRLHLRAGTTLSVVDEGIGGNRVLNSSPCCGASAIARFKRDVVRRAGVREVILLEGVNDIGFSRHTGAASDPHAEASAAQIIAGYRELIAQAHAARLRIFGGTITPFRGARYWTLDGEAEREALNHWILTSGAFDRVIDFARVIEDPGVPTMLAPAYDSGDHLHPNRAGYQAMANAVSLKMLAPLSGRFRLSVCSSWVRAGSLRVTI
jgi:lysophospholipase L1-like esterase